MVNMYGYQMGQLLAQLVVILTTVGTVTHMCLTVVYACVVATTITTGNRHDMLTEGEMIPSH